MRHGMKKAFTLAETLITLLIIGVVAALTVPNLMRNYQAAQLRSAFLEACSIVQNTSGMLAKDGVILNDLTPIEISKYFKTNDFKSKVQRDNTYNNFFGDGVKGANATVLSGEFTLPNGMLGMVFDIYQHGTNTHRKSIAIDINGKAKKPNRYGHDVFFWYYNQDAGQLEILGTANANRDLGYWQQHCEGYPLVTEQGCACGAKALVDPNWFKSLPK